MKFICQCGFEADLDVQSKVITHMVDCAQHKNSSFIHQAYQLYKLIPQEQLLILKADLHSQIEAIDLILETQELWCFSESSIFDGYQLTKQIIPDENIEIIKQTMKTATETLNQQITTIKVVQSFIVIYESNSEDESKGVLKNPDVFKGFQESPDINIIETCEKGMRISRIQKSSFQGSCVYCFLSQSEQVVSNQIYQMECGHSMCQTCFVLMYKNGQPLTCLNCECCIDRAFIVNASLNLERNSCKICGKQQFKDFFQTRRHIQRMHIGKDQKFCQISTKLESTNSTDQHNRIEKAQAAISDPIEKPI